MKKIAIKLNEHLLNIKQEWRKIMDLYVDDNYIDEKLAKKKVALAPILTHSIDEYVSEIEGVQQKLWEEFIWDGKLQEATDSLMDAYQDRLEANESTTIDIRVDGVDLDVDLGVIVMALRSKAEGA